MNNYSLKNTLIFKRILVIFTNGPFWPHCSPAARLFSAFFADLFCGFLYFHANGLHTNICIYTYLHAFFRPRHHICTGSTGPVCLVTVQRPATATQHGSKVPKRTADWPAAADGRWGGWLARGAVPQQKATWPAADGRRVRMAREGRHADHSVARLSPVLPRSPRRSPPPLPCPVRSLPWGHDVRFARFLIFSRFFIFSLDNQGKLCIINMRLRDKSETQESIAGLCKGSTPDSDSVCEGSNPSPAAKIKS